MLYRRPIAVIPNIAPALIEQPSRSGLAAELVAIGDAGPLKNMQALVDAWAILRADGREVKLNLIGHGLGRDDAFPRKVTACGLADGIEFHGPLNRESIAEVLSRSKVFVHPSLEECCPLSVLEAMRAGTPVVGGVRSGGVPWVLADGEAGVLIDVRQPFRIAEGIVRLLDDEDESQAIIARARDRVAKHFSARVVCEAYLAEYDRLRSESR
jgi:glycosyltransferase involved in cell wall biosynthesis